MVEKQGQKIRAGVSPPPFSGNAQKKTFFFFVRASLSDHEHVLIIVCGPVAKRSKCLRMRLTTTEGRGAYRYGSGVDVWCILFPFPIQFNTRTMHFCDFKGVYYCFWLREPHSP